MPRSLIHSILPAICVALCSCHNDEPAHVDIPGDAIYDIVTVAETTTKGTTYTFRTGADTPLITYTSPHNFTENKFIKEGTRITICYECQEGPMHTSGKIKLYGYGLMSNTQQPIIITGAGKYAGWESQPMQLSSMWRTGRYINLQTQLYVSRAEPPADFVMVLDPATAGTEAPEAHIVYKNAEGNDGENLYKVRASFDIDSVWSLDTTRELKVYYSSKGGTECVSFLKPQLQ